MLSATADKIKNPRTRMVIVVFVAFVAYSFFPLMSMTGEVVKFNSPDETANWVTALRIAEGEGIGIAEPLNKQAQNIIRPRSTTVIGENIVPSSFWGLPIIYGSIGLILSPYVLPFLTAFITSVSLLATYAIWRRIFSERTAIVATTIWAFNPALWYYASRGFYHNVLFIDLLIIAGWLYLAGREKKWPIDWVIGFVFTVALALFVRTNEATWILSIVFFGLWFERKSFHWQHYVAFLVSGLVAIMAWFSISDLIYGQSLTGYMPPGAVVSRWQVYLSFLWPFGLDLQNLVTAIYRYLLALMVPFWIFVGASLYFNRQQLTDIFKQYKWFVLSAVVVSVWLILYYGSWGVVDTVGQSGITIGNSHVRYWLPIIFLITPLVAIGIEKTAQYISPENRRLVASSLVLLLIGYGFIVAYFDRYEGLAHVAGRLEAYRAMAVYVDNNLPDNAVIISDRSDKVFFPERRAISPGDRPYFTFPEVLEGLPVVLDNAPVYVYTEGLFDSSASRLLGEKGIIIGEPLALPGSGWLYQLIKL